ncbi:MAG: gluconate 2-dehydrogenase subunit 3 family protein [Bacteroidota bacterium]
MKRRTALKNSAYLLGGVLSASTIAAIFESCGAPAAEGDVWTPEFLSVEEGKIVTKIADILIPSTDTPGAVEAGVPQYVDRVAATLLGDEEKKFVKEGFKAFMAAAKEATGKSFLDASAEEQLAFLQAQEKAFVEGNEPSLFGQMKQTIYQGFFTSEEGATQVLMYEPVPGNYDGCIPFSEVNGTWAT